MTAQRGNFKRARGIVYRDRPGRTSPFLMFWEVDGEQQSKSYTTAEERDEAAKALSEKREEYGREVLTFDPLEWRVWLSFKAKVGGADPLQVANEWIASRNGNAGKPRLTIRDAAAAFQDAKRAKGLDEATLSHYATVFKHLSDALGNEDCNTIKGEKLMEWVNGMDGEPWTKKTHFKRMASMFKWVKARRLIIENPCDGLEAPTVPEADVVLLSLQQARDLFEKNKGYRVVTRLALEAFGFLRASSAGRIQKDDIKFKSRGIRMPGRRHKSKKTKFRQGHPDNLWAWLDRAPEDVWTMTERQYREEKKAAFIRAGFEEGSDNRLRKTCLSAHLAWKKNPPLTRHLAQHTDERTTEIYIGVMDEADAAAYFQIVP